MQIEWTSSFQSKSKATFNYLLLNTLAKQHFRGSFQNNYILLETKMIRGRLKKKTLLICVFPLRHCWESGKVEAAFQSKIKKFSKVGWFLKAIQDIQSPKISFIFPIVCPSGSNNVCGSFGKQLFDSPLCRWGLIN